MSRVLGMLFLLMLQGCAWMFPYEQDFACPRKDHMGKCVSSMAAYDEITTGRSSGPHAQKASDRKKQDKKTKSHPSVVDDKVKSDTGYKNYVQSNYEQQRRLLERPVTPLLKTPEVLEMLVTSYKSDDGKRLYGQRTIHIIIQDSKFIMGDYLKTRTLPIESMFGED